ncbi:MAG: metal-dependent hydrolase [Evtepia sp.]
MQGTTHVSCGLCTAAAFAVFPPATSAVPLLASAIPTTFIAQVLLVATAALGSLIPDIDHPVSTISNHARLSGKLIRCFVERRGALHAPLLWIALALLCATFFPKIHIVIAGFLIGIVAHLALDSLNSVGIPLLWPLTKKKFHLLRIKTGSGLDRLIGSLFLIGFVGVLIAGVLQ